METSIAAPGPAFIKALRAFQTGGIPYGDFLARIKDQVAAGASAAELLQILRHREAVEPLPGYAHAAIVALLDESQRNSSGDTDLASATAIVESAIPPKPATVNLISPEAATVVLDDDDSEGASPAASGAQRTTVAAGDVLGERFHLVETIGQGGMSRVYKAVDLHDTEKASPDPYIAVKVLTRPFNGDSGSFSSLQEEVAKLRSLNHPNIVRMFGCDRDGSTVFMTMEYLTGDSLYTRLRADAPAGGPGMGLDRDDAQSIIAAVANALEYAHRHGVVHGDLKPGNVILTGGGAVKVIDFGIAQWVARPKRALDRRDAARDKPTSAVTPRYASPQLMARQKPQIEDDVYALACLTYEVFTGSHPFDDGTGAQTLRFPPPPRAELKSPQYAAVVRGLQFQRRNRTPSVSQFMEEFTGPTRRTAWKTRAVGLGAAAIAAVAIAVVVGWFYGRPAPKIPTPPPNADLARPAPAPVPVPAPPTPAQPGTVMRDCPTCPLLTVLPSGRFKQGSASADRGSASFERPQHQVVIGYAVALSTNDITVANFSEFVASTGRPMEGCDTYDGEWRHQRKASWKDPGFAQSALHPVTCASWNDAVAYAQWLSAKSGHRYRLPSASEWEYAARAGGETVRPWDSGKSDACANANVADESAAQQYPGWAVFACNDGYVNTAPVGSFKANAYGLNDMMGNVFQWTQDCWHDDYSGAPTDGSARSDGDCAERELRGGSWFSSPRYVKASYRNHFAADYRASSVGFRLVREISP
jgi:formylglycine-generating enzyme required for sulfatase activity